MVIDEEAETKAAPSSLLGRTAIVTGGGKSIGRAITIELALRGVEVTIGYNEDEASAQVTRLMIEGFGRKASVRCIPQLFASPTSSMITEIDADILVNNAAVAYGSSLLKMNQNEWDHTLEVNLNGVMVLTQAVAQGMTERGWGRIINIASVVGMDGRLGPSSYAASKAGLIGATKAWAHELARFGVTVNAVAPGFIEDTGLFDAVPDRYKLKIQEQIPLRRYGTVQDVAHAVSYLAAADYVTGHVLNVSGGYLT